MSKKLPLNLSTMSFKIGIYKLYFLQQVWFFLYFAGTNLMHRCAPRDFESCQPVEEQERVQQHPAALGRAIQGRFYKACADDVFVVYCPTLSQNWQTIPEFMEIALIWEPAQKKRTRMPWSLMTIILTAFNNQSLHDSNLSLTLIPLFKVLQLLTLFSCCSQISRSMQVERALYLPIWLRG